MLTMNYATALMASHPLKVVAGLQHRFPNLSYLSLLGNACCTVIVCARLRNEGLERYDGCNVLLLGWHQQLYDPPPPPSLSLSLSAHTPHVCPRATLRRPPPFFSLPPPPGFYAVFFAPPAWYVLSAFVSFFLTMDSVALAATLHGLKARAGCERGRPRDRTVNTGSGCVP
jgi:hypothetical protein